VPSIDSAIGQSTSTPVIRLKSDIRDGQERESDDASPLLKYEVAAQKGRRYWGEGQLSARRNVFRDMIGFG